MKGLTQLGDVDVKRGRFDQTDFYRRVRTFDPKDRVKIQQRILEVCGPWLKLDNQSTSHNVPVHRSRHGPSIVRSIHTQHTRY